MADPAQEGLRYRKKLKARLAVERAALELVLEHGYDEVTVEDICARAEISKKTFFNYFPSKAAAIRGRVEPFPDVDDLLALLEAHPETCYLDVIVEALGIQTSPDADDDVLQLRREVLASMPQLFFRGQRDFLTVQRVIADALRAYLPDHPEKRMLPNRSVDDEAVLASSVVLGLSRARSILHVRDDSEPTAKHIRLMYAAYLTADLDAR
ncbi:TetR family transcriptional regulator [Gordonibacter sp. An230]|uniref:TetR family transcriptional regulator n=1 Tax=Gordonibacter sp. An230 TaxID=1965592 RepID=UPI000B3997AB|nr:TetR family transcriptional regulator [Gordonibacter sp. An230]OUO91124.1 TetR family transcriptional regulator [Gordonibacter sp. An230]